MNRRVRMAVLRILVLVEEFSSEELAEAASLIGGQKEEDLLAFLSRSTTSPKRSSAPPSGESRVSKQGETQALQELKSVGGEKYQVLRDFETAIRAGSVLKTLE